MDDLIQFLESRNEEGIDIGAIQAYRERYGTQQ